MKDFWPLFVWLGWMVFCVWFWRRRAQRQQRSVDDAWSGLARRTGLSYDPGSGAALLGGIAVARKKPSIRGRYRGRPLLLTIVGESVSLYDGVVWIAHTRVWIKVRNHVGCSLIVQEKGLLARTFRKGKTPSETLAIDPRFSVKGRTPEFRQHAISLIGSLSRDRPTMQINQSPFFWTSHSRSPIIKLKGSDLFWQQYDVLTDASELITLLNQLCDLAQLIEEMGREVQA
jgi:hypothetical protein